MSVNGITNREVGSVGSGLDLLHFIFVVLGLVVICQYELDLYPLKMYPQTKHVAYTCSLFFLLLFVAFHRIYMFVCFCLLPLVGE